MAVATDTALAFLDRLDAAPTPAAGPLPSVRKAGRERFAESGFPSRRTEAWRFTDLKPLLDASFAPAAADAGALDAHIEDAVEGGEADLLVFVDGRLDAARSRVGTLPEGAHVGSFARWAQAHEAEARALFDLGGGVDKALLSLNAAFFADGPVVIVPEGVTLPRRVVAVYWNTGAPAHVKSLVRLGAGAQAVLVESFGGSGAGWTNVAVDADLGEGARLGLYTLQAQAVDAIHTAHLAVRIGKGATLDGFLLTLGSRLARQDAKLVLAGEGGLCGYSGAYLLDGRQESAVASLIEHAAPGCRTHEVFKGCVDHRAHGVFQGKILVDQVAQKTDGYQLSKTILLGDRAVMDAKPELEIYADDVKCSHGATVGDLDENSFFYLRSRGIEPATARRMLIEAFLVDTIDLIAEPATKAYFRRAVAAKLATQGAGR